MAGLAGVLAAGLLGLSPTHRRQAHHAELRRDHRRRPRQSARNAARRLDDRRRLRAGGGLFSLRHRSGDLCDDGAGAAHPARAAFSAKRGGCIDGAARARAFDAAVCLLLLFMPFWMGAIGGYTELATRIVVMGLAAMSLNFLLGFTGVLSFGHAAYFGLGAYGAAMAIKYLGVGTIPAIGLGIVVGDARRDGDRRADRQATRRLFRHGDDRLRPGVLFSRLPLELGDRRRRRPDRLAPPADQLRLRHARHLRQRQGVLLFRAGGVRGLRRARWRCCSIRRSGAR